MLNKLMGFIKRKLCIKIDLILYFIASTNYCKTEVFFLLSFRFAIAPCFGAYMLFFIYR